MSITTRSMRNALPPVENRAEEDTTPQTRNVQEPTEDEEEEEATDAPTVPLTPGTRASRNVYPLTEDNEDEEGAISPVAPLTMGERSKKAYALTPALVSNEPLDYGTSSGAKIYKQATEKLKTEYDMKGETIHLFLVQLEDRALSMGWSTICQIPDEDGIKRNIFTEFGQLTEQAVEQHAAVYMGIEDKRKQLAVQMSTCILNSLTDAALIEIRIVRPRFTVNNVHHGPLLLWEIIQRATINVKASAALLRQKLWGAPETLREKKYDVQEFNAHIDSVMFQLRARGEEAPDTLLHLFRAYKSVPNGDFVQYIKHKESLYEEAEIDLSPQKIMSLAITKYNTIKEQGGWDQTDKAGDEIIAMKAEIAMLKQQSKRTPEQAKRSDERFAWKEKKVPGKEKITKNNKTYYWCPHHKAYTIHKPDECRLDPKKQKKEKDKEEAPVTGMTALYTKDTGFNTFGDEIMVDDE